MKIALISQYFYPESFSNTEIARFLVDQGHDVDVVCCVPNYPAGVFFEGYSNRFKRHETLGDISIYRAWTFPRGHKNWHLLLNYLVFPLAAAWTFLTVARARHDVSLVSMPSPLLQAFAGVFLKWMRGTPVVYWVQDIWPESAVYTLGLKNPIILKPLTWVCGWLYRRADLILVQSQAFPAMIERFGVELGRIRVFPNTAPESYHPLTATQGRALVPHLNDLLKPGPFTVMFAGNIGESQDFDTLIDAAKIVQSERTVRWAIVGSGRDMDRVQSRIAAQELTDSFIFLGRHPEAEMPAFFAQADAMLVSLKKTPIFELTVPYKIQCYMACGKPILSSLDGEGCRILSVAGAGLTAPAQSPQDLAENIIAMCDMATQDRDAMGARGQTYFQDHYHRNLVFGQLDQWLAEIADQ